MLGNYVSIRLGRKLSLAIYLSLAYKDHVLQYKQALKKAETDYYITIISDVGGNQELFLKNKK